MRIISGKAKGTKLYTLDGNETRPTLDRVKEPLFSILQFQIEDAEVLDLFAGSGALGLECISRGAKQCILCDNSDKAIQIIKQNIVKTKAEENTTVIYSDYLKCLKKLEENKKQFDLIFLDPPYKQELLIQAIEEIIKKELLKEKGIIIAETDEEEKIREIEKQNINIRDVRKYGRVTLIFLNRKG